MNIATPYKSTRYVLLVALSVVMTMPANAQTAHKAAKSKASVQALPAPAPVLEP